jgi:hypothetical protein
MRFRTYKNTDLMVSEVGFGLWTISTGWWGNFTEGEAIALMHKVFDFGHHVCAEKIDNLTFARSQLPLSPHSCAHWLSPCAEFGNG